MTIRQRIDSAARFALFAAVAVSGGRGSVLPEPAEAEAAEAAEASNLKAVLKNRKT